MTPRLNLDPSLLEDLPGFERSRPRGVRKVREGGSDRTRSETSRETARTRRQERELKRERAEV